MTRKRLSAVGLGAILLAGSSLLSRVLGIVRDFVFSKVFGVGAQGGEFALDAYFAAFRIPDLLYTLLIFGAMSAAFIPIYTRLLKSDEDGAFLFGSRILNGLLVLLLAVSVLAFIFASKLVPLIAPGFEANILEITIKLTKIMLLSPIFLGLSSVFQGIENSHKKFLGIATAPIVYNLSIILAAWLYAPKYGVFALAWGVAIGAFLHFLVQVPGVFRTSFKYRFDWNFRSRSVRDFVKLTIPRLFGVSVSQLGIFVDTIIASLLAVGSLSIFNYALNLQSLPYGVVAISFSVAIFSTLSEDAIDENKGEFLKTMRKSTHTILFWVLPAILGLFILRDAMVTLILRGGAFDEQAAMMTAFTLGIFAWAAIGQSFIPLFARAFYALHETKRPVVIGLIAVILNMTVSLVLTQVYDFGVWALAVSAVVSSSVNAILLVWFLARFMKLRFFDFFDVKSLGLIMVKTAIMVAVIYFLEATIIFPNVLSEVLLVAFLGFGVYMGLARLMKTIPSLYES